MRTLIILLLLCTNAFAGIAFNKLSFSNPELYTKEDAMLYGVKISQDKHLIKKVIERIKTAEYQVDKLSKLEEVDYKELAKWQHELSMYTIAYATSQKVVDKATIEIMPFDSKDDAITFGIRFNGVEGVITALEKAMNDNLAKSSAEGYPEEIDAPDGDEMDDAYEKYLLYKLAYDWATKEQVGASYVSMSCIWDTNKGVCR